MADESSRQSESLNPLRRAMFGTAPAPAPAPASVIIGPFSVGFIRNPMSQSFNFWRFLFIGCAMTIGGFSVLFNAQDDRFQDTFEATTYYRGREPKSAWVAIDGRLLWDGAAYEGTDYSGTWYVPLVGPDWKGGDEVKLVVKVNSNVAEDWGEMRKVEGMLDRSLPSHVRKYFESEGPRPAKTVMLLREGASPGYDERAAHIMIVIGLVVVGGSLTLYKPNPLPHTKSSSSGPRQLTLGPRKADLAELNGEISAADPQIVAREDEVRRWMLEHGLPTPEPEPAADPEPEEQLA